MGGNISDRVRGWSWKAVTRWWRSDRSFRGQNGRLKNELSVRWDGTIFLLLLTLTVRSSSTYLYYDDEYCLPRTYISPGLSPSQAQPSPLFGFWLGSRFYEAQAVQSQAQAGASGQARARTSLRVKTYHTIYISFSCPFFLDHEKT